MEYFEKTISSELVYKGNIINVERVTVELPNGKLATRDVVRNRGAAAIVPVTSDGCIILVEQFRKPNERVFIEIPAGKLDEGEAPENCAIRELEEETGYRAESLKKILTLNPTPAFADELLHIYIATGLTKGEAKPDEDEFISAKSYPAKEVLDMIEKGIITDSKSVAGILLAARMLKL